MTAKQKQFCINYVEHYNARKAYLDAFGCSEGTANSEAYQLLKRDDIKRYIRELEKEAFERNGINAEHIANELAKQAFGEIDNVNGMTYQVKQKALELLGKQLQLYTQKVDLKSNQTITINITEEVEDGD